MVRQNEAMISLLANATPFLFYALFFFVPLALYPYSSELFEFNKTVLVYALTALILTSWSIKMLLAKKIIFRRTMFDIPILIFLFSQALSTIASIDFRTSLLGYYSRFNGGFLSYLCYSLVFWAFVANMDRVKTLKCLRFLLLSGALVSIYGVLEHFGIDKDLWVQDVASRVFSTLGQPNWLAAFLVALLPITWASAISSKYKIFPNKSRLIPFTLSALYFLTLLYTKSRSGLLAFLLVSIVFWSPILFIYIRSGKLKLQREFIKKFLIINVSFVILFLLTPTPYFQGVTSLIFKQNIKESETPQGPALEVGGTESGTIRKIVWKGALDIFKNYPLMGTGVETFAYSYYQYRPVEHNLVSEWDFLYNKAHNEYLNFAANTGILGLGTYLFLLGSIIYYFVKNWKFSRFNLAFGAGIFGIGLTNFFGFSVVVVSLLLFAFPAMAVSLELGKNKKVLVPRLSFIRKSAVVILAGIGFWLIFLVGRYWYADLSYSRGKLLNDAGDFVKARESLVRAINLSPKEAIFWDELAQSDSELAVVIFEAGEKDKANEFAQAALRESQNAISLSPRNINLKRNRATAFIKLSSLDETFLNSAADTLLDALTFAPTDAKLYYNLGLTYLRLGKYEEAIKILKKTVGLKPNYRDARLALALSYIDIGEKVLAKVELNYILEKIEPDDAITRQTLEDIK